MTPWEIRQAQADRIQKVTKYSGKGVLQPRRYSDLKTGFFAGGLIFALSTLTLAGWLFPLPHFTVLGRVVFGAAALIYCVTCALVSSSIFDALFIEDNSDEIRAMED